MVAYMVTKSKTEIDLAFLFTMVLLSLAAIAKESCTIHNLLQHK